MGDIIDCPRVDSSSRKRFSVDCVLAAAMVVAAVLLFWGLGGRDLWQDEAETAMLAKNILRFKRPVVFDGINLVSSEAGKDFGPDMVWRWSPWLQFYLAAASMALFGLNTAAARLPSALLGLLCLPLTFYFARLAFGSLALARLSVVLLGLSTPFLLHCRQARWYALAYALVLGLFISLFELERRPKAAPLALALCAILLFYTNYLVAIGLLAALCAAVPILKPDGAFLKRLFLTLGAAALGVIPGLRFFDVLGKAGDFSPARAAAFLAQYSALFFTQLLPLPMLALLLWALMRRGPSRSLDPARGRRALFLLACAGFYVCYLALVPWLMLRYLAVLLPLCAVLLALAVEGVLGERRLLGAALAILLVGTDALHRLPLGAIDSPATRLRDRYARVGPVSSPLAGFLREITHEFDDCSRVLVDHLKANARSTDTVLVTYGDAPLQFYTGLKVVGAFQGQELGDRPDWIVIRSVFIDRRPGRDLDVLRFIMGRVDLRRYVKVDLRCRDFMLGNCPEPLLHLFEAPPEGRGLTVFKLAG